MLLGIGLESIDNERAKISVGNMTSLGIITFSPYHVYREAYFRCNQVIIPEHHICRGTYFRCNQVMIHLGMNQSCLLHWFLDLEKGQRALQPPGSGTSWEGWVKILYTKFTVIDTRLFVSLDDLTPMLQTWEVKYTVLQRIESIGFPL